jgi:hypothetical protein
MKQRTVRPVILVLALASGLAVPEAVADLTAEGAAAGISAQEIQHETRTINIEVPVRVFKGAAFVENLTIADFELYENGRPQTLDAVYLVKKSFVERREDSREFAPDTGRHFYLFFEMTEYDPKVREALDYFVRQVLAPGDEFVVVTPLKTYRMKSDILKSQTRDIVFEKIMGLLRHDILVGNAEYDDVIEEMQALAATMAASIVVSTTDQQTQQTQQIANPFTGGDTIFDAKTSMEEQLQMYAACLSRLENIRDLDQAKVLGLADHLRNQTGQKEIFMFYQREYIPRIDSSVLNALMSIYNERPDITETVSSVFEFFRRDTPLDIQPVKKSFSDSGATIHFLYLTRPAPKVRGVIMEEQSEDIFSPFREMSLATGGFMASTANLDAAMRSAVAASENYYLLYYTPRDYKADGTFRSLEVKVKGGDYRTGHRQGYIAN